MRWSNPGIRNIDDCACQIPRARDMLKFHVNLADQNRTLWEHLWSNARRGAKGLIVGEVSTLAADALVPLCGSILMKLLKSGTDFHKERCETARSFAAHEERHLDDAAEGFAVELRELLGSSAPLPIVLWLDDAHWIDPLTMKLIRMVMAEGRRGKWPLLVIATHWEREWRTFRVPDRLPNEPRLTDFEHDGDVKVEMLKVGADIDLGKLIRIRFPGLDDPQVNLLIEKSARNYLSLVADLAELQSNLAWFNGRDLAQALTPEAVERVRRRPLDRRSRTRARFDALTEDIRVVLGLGSTLGRQFLADVVSDFAAGIVKSEMSAALLLEECIDPLAILSKPNPMLTEFRSDVSFEVARAFATENDFAQWRSVRPPPRRAARALDWMDQRKIQ